MTFDEIVTAVRDQGGFAVTDSVIGGWINERHREAVAQSKWLEQEQSLGVTVVDRGDYDIPAGVVDIVGIYLDRGEGPEHWARVSPTDMWAVKAGRKHLRGSGGVFAPKFGTAGEKRIELFPAPEVAGTTIVSLAAMLPAAMVSGSSPVIPEDMHGALVDGAIALGLLRMDERADSSAVFEARFQAMVQGLARRKRSRVGSEVARMQVWRHDW